MTKPLIALGALAVILAGGCASQREIETSRPRPRQEADGGSAEATRQARLIVSMQKGRTEMPADVESLQFRLTEVRLRPEGGDWIRMPTDGGMIELDQDAGSGRRTVLDARIEPSRYDSLAISFERVYVEFNENAGAPLTTADGIPQRLAIDLELDRSSPTSLTLNLEAGASLTRSPDCGWFFVPVLQPEIERADDSSVPSQH